MDYTELLFAAKMQELAHVKIARKASKELSIDQKHQWARAQDQTEAIAEVMRELQHIAETVRSIRT